MRRPYFVNAPVNGERLRRCELPSRHGTGRFDPLQPWLPSANMRERIAESIAVVLVLTRGGTRFRC